MDGFSWKSHLEVDIAQGHSLELEEIGVDPFPGTALSNGATVRFVSFRVTGNGYDFPTRLGFYTTQCLKFLPQSQTL